MIDAKTLYPFPAHRSPLAPRKAATCCQTSQRCRVVNAHQEKADWIQEQNWFIAHRLVTQSQHHSNVPQELGCAPDILPHRGSFEPNREADTPMSPWERTHRFSGKQNQNCSAALSAMAKIGAALPKARAFRSPLGPGYSSFSWMSGAPDFSGRGPAPIFLFQATAHAQVWAHQVPLAATPAEPDLKNLHLLGMRRERVKPLIFISNKTRSCSSHFVISQIKCFATHNNDLISGSHN